LTGSFFFSFQDAIGMSKNKPLIIGDEMILNKIYRVRDKKVMLDRDLTSLYGVTTGNLNLAVKRNTDRFPVDFMFRLTKEELETLILQNAISKKQGRGGTRKLPLRISNKEQGISNKELALRNEKSRSLLHSIFLVPCSLFISGS
jgi:hypothetical protein